MSVDDPVAVKAREPGSVRRVLKPIEGRPVAAAMLAGIGGMLALVPLAWIAHVATVLPGSLDIAGLKEELWKAIGVNVRIGGVVVRQMSSAQLAAQISQIIQDVYLFPDRIADNIRIGRADASYTEVLEVARQSGVPEILARLPQGLDTPVGEGGARLSGGDHARIAIARALLKDAPVLLVDKATAALDAQNQAVITEVLERLRGKRTIVVIAHQLGTVLKIDQIVVLNVGIVFELGTHEELCSGNGPYARFQAQRSASQGWRIVLAGLKY